MSEVLNASEIAEWQQKLFTDEDVIPNPLDEARKLRETAQGFGVGKYNRALASALFLLSDGRERMAHFLEADKERKKKAYDSIIYGAGQLLPAKTFYESATIASILTFNGYIVPPVFMINLVQAITGKDVRRLIDFGETGQRLEEREKEAFVTLPSLPISTRTSFKQYSQPLPVPFNNSYFCSMQKDPTGLEVLRGAFHLSHSDPIQSQLRRAQVQPMNDTMQYGMGLATRRYASVLDRYFKR